MGYIVSLCAFLFVTELYGLAGFFKHDSGFHIQGVQFASPPTQSANKIQDNSTYLCRPGYWRQGGSRTGNYSFEGPSQPVQATGAGAPSVTSGTRQYERSQLVLDLPTVHLEKGQILWAVWGEDCRAVHGAAGCSHPLARSRMASNPVVGNDSETSSFPSLSADKIAPRRQEPAERQRKGDGLEGQGDLYPSPSSIARSTTSPEAADPTKFAAAVFQQFAAHGCAFASTGEVGHACGCSERSKQQPATRHRGASGCTRRSGALSAFQGNAWSSFGAYTGGQRTESYSQCQANVSQFLGDVRKAAQQHVGEAGSAASRSVGAVCKLGGQMAAAASDCVRKLGQAYRRLAEDRLLRLRHEYRGWQSRARSVESARARRSAKGSAESAPGGAQPGQKSSGQRCHRDGARLFADTKKACQGGRRGSGNSRRQDRQASPWSGPDLSLRRWEGPLAMLAAWEHSILQCWNYVSPCAAVGLAAQLHMEVTWPWLATDSRGLVDDRIIEHAHQVDAGWQGTTAACAPEKYTRWIDSLADMGRYSEIESPPGQETWLSPVFSPCLPSVMPLAHDEVHCELLYSSGCTDKRVTFESRVSFWFPASDQICLPGKDRFFLPKQGRPPRGILKSSRFLPAAKHSLLHSTRESVFPRSLEVEVCLDVPDVQMDPVSNTDAVAVHCLSAEADVDDDTVPHASVSLACLQRLGKSVDEALACGLGRTPCTGIFPQGTTCPAGGPAAAVESGARRVEASAFSSGSSPAKPLHTPDTPFLPIERATVSSSSGTHAADWFTMFGTVEGHQVLRKLPDWSDFRCITEAIAHAAPALLRPSGSTLVAPLPGLFVPQVVLTRQVPNTGFKTIVCDLRAIGADIRVEDIRVGRSVASVTEGEGALVHLLASLRVRSHDLSFVVNHQAVLPGFMLDQHSESITLSWRPRAGEAAEAPTRASPASSNEGETRQPSFDVSGSSRWGSGSSWDHRVYRPLRPPTPPLPPDAMPNVAAMNRAILGGLQFTVFDEHHHRRSLPRHEGQGELDLVELALSLTPEIHRPWGHRVLTQEWPDWPSPQLVIWGPLNDGHRVIPIQNRLARRCVHCVCPRRCLPFCCDGGR